MKMLRQVSERNQVTIPARILRDAGVRPGDYLEVVEDGGAIVLNPTAIGDDTLSRDDWDALDRLVRRETAAKQFTEYADVRTARKHLEKPRS